jgi:hypothetical protein
MAPDSRLAGRAIFFIGASAGEVQAISKRVAGLPRGAAARVGAGDAAAGAPG